jgi:CheY-like chemotaxis protein
MTERGRRAGDLAEEGEPETRPASRATTWPEELAGGGVHEQNNLLMIVVANLEFLAELNQQIGLEAAELAPSKAANGIRARLADAATSIDDANNAVQRLRALGPPTAMPALMTRLPPPSRSISGVRSAARERTAVAKRTTGIVPRIRVLVIDDEVALGRTVCRILPAAYDVVAAATFAAALARFVGGDRFDVILCDLMSGMTGCEFFVELQRLAPEQARRVIFMTGGATPQALRFLQTVSQPILPKPFGAADIRAVVDDVLSGARDLPG